MSNLETAMSKLDAAGLTEGETQAVADFLTAVMSPEDTDEAEVSGFGYDPKPNGFLLEVARVMRPASGFTVTLTQARLAATDDLARANGFGGERD